VSQGVDVMQVAGLEADFGALSLQLFRERAAPLGIHVDEADPRALGRKRTDSLWPMPDAPPVMKIAASFKLG
jgi:hypothetical protein